MGPHPAFAQLGFPAGQRVPVRCPGASGREKQDMGVQCPADDPGGRAARGALNTPLIPRPGWSVRGGSGRAGWLVPRQRGNRGAELSRGQL